MRIRLHCPRKKNLQNGGGQNTDLQYMDFTHMHYPKMDYADEV